MIVIGPLGATPARPSRPPRPASAVMSEAVLMTAVRRQARVWGWRCYHTHRSDRSDPGWPDLVLAHPVHRLLLVRELKTEKGRLTPDQRIWLDLLVACGVDAAVWRPVDLANGVIERALFIPRPASTRTDPNR